MFTTWLQFNHLICVQFQIFACGFESGTIRIFHVSSTSVLSEHPNVHNGSRVTCVVFSPDGERLISSCLNGKKTSNYLTCVKYRGKVVFLSTTGCA